jgi:hypothetical protein
VEVVRRVTTEFTETHQVSELVAPDFVWDLSSWPAWTGQPEFEGRDSFMGAKTRSARVQSLRRSASSLTTVARMGIPPNVTSGGVGRLWNQAGCVGSP